jgi:hypothetical protein
MMHLNVQVTFQDSEYETHRSEVSFLEGQCGERNHCVESCPYQGSASRHLYKASRPSYICALAGGTWRLLPFLVDSWGISFLYHMYHTMFYFDAYTCFA